MGRFVLLAFTCLVFQDTLWMTHGLQSDDACPNPDLRTQDVNSLLQAYTRHQQPAASLQLSKTGTDGKADAHAIGYIGNSKACFNTDHGATDAKNQGCDAYDNDHFQCLRHLDDSDFQADSMCCVCGGGRQKAIEKPHYVFVTSGTCTERGFDWIYNYNECTLAAESLKIFNSPSKYEYVSGGKLVVRNCATWQRKNQNFPSLFYNDRQSGKYYGAKVITSCGSEKRCICKAKAIPCFTTVHTDSTCNNGKPVAPFGLVKSKEDCAILVNADGECSATFWWYGKYGQYGECFCVSWGHTCTQPSAMIGTQVYKLASKDSCGNGYVERSLVADEGNSVGDFLAFSLDRCKTFCNMTSSCKSFSYGHDNCHLKDKEVSLKDAASSDVTFKTYIRQDLPQATIGSDEVAANPKKYKLEVTSSTDSRCPEGLYEPKMENGSGKYWNEGDVWWSKPDGSGFVGWYTNDKAWWFNAELKQNGENRNNRTAPEPGAWDECTFRYVIA